MCPGLSTCINRVPGVKRSKLLHLVYKGIEPLPDLSFKHVKLRRSVLNRGVGGGGVGGAASSVRLLHSGSPTFTGVEAWPTAQAYEVGAGVAHASLDVVG